MDPSEDQDVLDRIRKWPFQRAGDFWDLMRYMKELMEPMGRVWEDEDGNIRLATGGWSTNEVLMQELKGNFIIWSLTWHSSHRGGLTILKSPEIKGLGEIAECRL
jgi:hypothetical protein